jgi:hypothetical protein
MRIHHCECGRTIQCESIEAVGRRLLIEGLERAGFKVARPEGRDVGVDLVVWGAGRTVPIQLKSHTADSFELDAKYERFSGMVIVHQWHVLGPAEAVETFCLTYAEAFDVAKQMGFTRTPSWARGRYFTHHCGRELRLLLKPFRMELAEKIAATLALDNAA